MTPDDLATRILAVVAATPGGAASFAWVEVQLLATLFPTPDALADAPGHHVIQNAIWNLIEVGRLVMVPGRRVKVPE